EAQRQRLPADKRLDILVRQHENQLGAAALVLTGIGDHQHHVADRRVGDPHFLPVDDHVVAVAHGAGLDSAGVGAGVGLGRAGAAELLALQQGRNVALLLLRRATVVEAYGARFLAATDERYDGRKLFLHEPEGERRDAGAAGFLWQSQPGEAERGADVDNLAGDFAGQRLVRILRLQDRVD